MRVRSDGGPGTRTAGNLCLISFLLVIAVVAVYLPLWKAGFVNYDDPDYVTANPHVLTGITWKNLRWAFVTNHADNWHPVTWISHMLDCQWFGKRAVAHHLVNLLFHAANSVLLFLWLRRITAAMWRSAFVAALFALHPLHVESVAWIAERKDVLSTFFWFLALLSYTSYAVFGKRRGYLLALIFFAIGLMAKPMLVTLPCVLLLLDYWPLGRFPGKQPMRLLAEKIPFFMLGAVSSAITLVAQHKRAFLALEAAPLSLRFQNAILACAGYLGKMICPVKLAVIYPYNFHPALIPVLTAAISLALITTYVIVLRRRLPWLVTGWFWFCGTLVPVIGIVQVGVQAMADRYTYIPLIGMFIVVAWGGAALGDWMKIPVAVRAALAVIALATSGVLAHAQAVCWGDSVTLFSQATGNTTGNDVAETNLGAALTDKGEYGEAIEHLETALRIQPRDAIAWNSLGIALLATGRTNEAAAAYENASKANPSSADAHNNLGIVFARQGKMEEAVHQLSEALRVDPASPNTRQNLGNVYLNMGRPREALAQYLEAVRLKPDFRDAHCNIAALLLREGLVSGAIEHYEAALKSKPDDLEALDGLVTAYDRAGRASDALRVAQHALDVAKSSGQTSMASKLQKRIESPRMKEKQNAQ